MFITTLSIDVAWNRANRSLVMDVFSFVDLLFIVDPPRKVDGGGVVHEHMDFDLFSFIPASGVEVFVRSSLSGLFLVGFHDMVTCVILYNVGGVRKRIGGIYIPPDTKKWEWLACEATWIDCDFLMGDFNAKHNDWNLNSRTGRKNAISDCRSSWLTQFCDRQGLQVHPPTGCMFRDVSAIDLFIGSSKTRVSYDWKAGLEHVAVIARLEVDELIDMVRRRPSWRNIPASSCDEILEHVDSGSDEEMWLMRGGVDPLPRSGRNISRCPFWNPDLQRIRSELNRMRRIRRRLPVTSDDYNVVRRVYRAMLLRSRQEFIRDTIEKA